ncbi:hypothetical protein BWI17_11160 [Betaproteobacteria bacterium GR16-43]|nr:hypothetical protein BWI17_11160 [Betaproteobacteria bacterium GR16-43]
MKFIRLLWAVGAIAGMSGSAALAAVPGVADKEILIGQDVDLSGTIAVRMRPLVQAADAYLEKVNKAGGVHGRKITVLRLDSGNKPERTRENVKALVEDKHVFAMWGISGTGNVAAALPYVAERGVPLIGSTSGADPFYSVTHPMLFNLKAGYNDEIRRTTAHLKVIFVQRLGLIYIDNGFGREVLKSALAAAKDNGIDVVATAGFKEDGSDIQKAVDEVAKQSPAALYLLSLSGPAPKVVDAYLKTGKPTQIFALSIVAPDALFKSLGPKSRGITVTQIVPFPWDRSVPIVKEYQDLMRSKGVEEFSHAGMEGYLLAKALVEGLRDSGRNPTRASVVTAFEAMKDRDLGGMKLSFSPQNHNGTGFVDLNMIGKDGRLVR